MHHLCGILAGTTKREPKMWENINSRNLKSRSGSSFSTEGANIKNNN